MLIKTDSSLRLHCNTRIVGINVLLTNKHLLTYILLYEKRTNYHAQTFEVILRYKKHNFMHYFIGNRFY